MKNLIKTFSIVVLSLNLFGCDKAPNLGAEEPKWDVQTCDRCKMLLSDHFFSAQIVNPKDGKHFYFDDLGCALMWLENPQNKGWSKDAIIYATNPTDGKWLNTKEAVIVNGYVTPMAYGLAVLPKDEKIPEGKKKLSLEEAISQVKNIKKQKDESHPMGR